MSQSEEEYQEPLPNLTEDESLALETYGKRQQQIRDYTRGIASVLS
jgi:hypothetical protein